MKSLIWASVMASPLAVIGAFWGEYAYGSCGSHGNRIGLTIFAALSGAWWGAQALWFAWEADRRTLQARLELAEMAATRAQRTRVRGND